MWILLIVLAFILAALLFNTFAVLYEIPAGGYKKRLVNMNKGNKNKRTTLVSFAQRFIKLDEEKRGQMIIDIERCDMKTTPEEFYAEAVSIAIVILLCSPVFIIFGMGFMCVLTVLLALTIFFKKIKIISENVDKLNREIILEFPMFIRNFSYNLESTRDIIEIIDRYRTIAGKALKNELDILVTDMKTGNYEDAISKFDRRLNLEPVTSFATGVMGISRGIDYKTYFFLLEENMKVLAKENLKREIKKRPGKLQKAVLAMVILIGLLYMVPIIIQMKDGLNIFN